MAILFDKCLDLVPSLVNMKAVINMIRITVFLICLFGLSFSCTEAKKPPPNILWITCEDISPTLAMYGDSTAHTPALDKLAAEGLIFDNAFTTVGVCAPSRSSIITGMYPTSIGTQNMRTGFDVIGWGRRKYDKPFGAKDIEGHDIPLYSAVVPPEVKCFTEYLRKEGYFCTNNPKTDYQFAAPVSAWDENGFDAHWKHREKNQPFFAVFNLGVTHESMIWRNKDKPLTVDPATVPLPPYFPEDSIIRRDVARNYSNIELMDKQVAALLKEVEDAGLMDNTIVFFYSDHGGPLPKGKREHYDVGLKVPFIVRYPDGSLTGRTDEIISFVDLAPTILSLAGIPVPDYMQGKAFLGKQKSELPRHYAFGSGDRFDEFPDRIRTVRDSRYRLVKNFYPELPPYKDVAYRKNMDLMNELLALNKEGKLTGIPAQWFKPTKPPFEFYDTKTDPYNVHNLVNEPEYSGKIEELKDALDTWMMQVGDMAETPEYQMIMEMWPGGIQPVCPAPVVDQKGKKISISTDLVGASLVYIVSDSTITPDLDAGWLPYQKTIKLRTGQHAYFMNTRIGFADSEIVEEER